MNFLDRLPYTRICLQRLVLIEQAGVQHDFTRRSREAEPLDPSLTSLENISFPDWLAMRSSLTCFGGSPVGTLCPAATLCTSMDVLGNDAENNEGEMLTSRLGKMTARRKILWNCGSGL